MLPLSEPLPAAEREAFAADLNGVLGGALAPESFVPAQAFYYGRLAGGGELRMALSEGREVDRLPALRARAVGRNGQAYVPARQPGDTPPVEDSGFQREPDWHRIKGALSAIPAEECDHEATGGYNLWLQIGMALHDEASGSDEGLQVFDNWSRGGAKYNARAVSDKWESFSRKPGGVGIARSSTWRNGMGGSHPKRSRKSLPGCRC